MTWKIPAAAFVVVAAACLPAGEPGPGPEPADLPRITPSDWRFGWEETERGAWRSVDVTVPGEVDVETGDAVTAGLGVMAIDRLEGPAIDGRRLVDVMPPGSTVLVRPDGTAVFSYGDLFDPAWRGRVPVWEALETEDGTLTVDRLADGAAGAKVATAATADEMLFVADTEGDVSFFWMGELRYCFELGRPLRSFALADLSGTKKTTVEVPAGFEVRLSVDGRRWETVWRSEEEGPATPTVGLPSWMVGAERICVGLDAGEGEFATADRLDVTVELDATDLVDLTSFEAGTATVTLDTRGEPARALLFWDAPGLAVVGAGEMEAPAVVELRAGDDEWVAAFPNGAVLRIPADGGGRPAGIGRLQVDGVPVFDATASTVRGPVSLDVAVGEPLPGPGLDWVTYRQGFLDSGRWASRGERVRRTLDEEDLVFEGAEVRDDQVVFTWSVATPGGAGTVEWVLSGASPEMAGGRFAGVAMSWRLRGPGLDSVEGVVVDVPVPVAPGEHEVGQYFRALVEDEVVLASPPRRPDAVWFENSQSFVFFSGPGRTVIGYFDRPTSATVSTAREAGRDRFRFRIPVGPGGDTAALVWAVLGVGAGDAPTAVDAWAAVYEDLRTGYLRTAGVADTRPVPTLVWNQPGEEAFVADLESYVATGEYPTEGWFRWFADNRVERAAEVGIANVIIQAPWWSDAEDPELVSSFHAPRALEVSKLLGGVDGLEELVARAHRAGVAVTLWYPSGYSIRSPLFEENPDWVVWQRSGIPEDGGWGDVIAVDPGEEYRRYVVDRLTELRRRVPFDGAWMDSWAALAVPVDFSDPRPVPRLDDAVALQRAFTEMGLTQIVIEGLGPVGRGDAYGDYETYSGPPDPLPAQEAEMERLRGREYLLYRIGAGVYLDVDVYERALAAGGLVNVANLDEVDALDDDARERFRDLNVAYMAVKDRMDSRSLLYADGRWVGVAWTSEDSDGVVVFTFEDLLQGVDGSVTVTDVVTGDTFVADGTFRAEAHRVYVVGEN